MTKLKRQIFCLTTGIASLLTSSVYATPRFKCDVHAGTEIVIQRDWRHTKPDRETLSRFVSEIKDHGGLVALEGLYFNDAAKNDHIIPQYAGVAEIIAPLKGSILGMEDPIAFDAISAILQIYESKFYSPPETSQANMRSFLLTFGGSEIGRLSWQDFKNSREHSQRDVDAELDFLGNMTSLSPSFLVRVDRILADNRLKKDLIAIRYPLTLQMVKSIRERFPRLFRQSEIETLWYLPQLVRHFSSPTDEVNEFAKKLVRINDTVRESLIEQNIADLLCDSLQSGKKLYVRIGASHFQALKRNLEAASSHQLTVKEFH